MERFLQNIFIVLDFRVAIVAVMTMFSTWFCINFGLSADLPIDIFVIAIIVPLVISTYTAFKRREKALEDLSGFKAAGVSIYMASRDWLKTEDDDLKDDLKDEMKKMLCQSYTSVSVYLFSHGKDALKYEVNVHRWFSDISKFIKSNFEDQLTPAEFTRINTYLGEMVNMFHRLKTILNYETPVSLRMFSTGAVMFLPIVYGPYFAYNYVEGAGVYYYLLPLFFSGTLVCLVNVHEQLDDPYDQIGEDDIKLDIESFTDMMD